jgi:predicted transcriptional regulator
MRLRELVEKLELTVHAGEAGLDHEVSGGYVGDLMSDAIARAAPGSVWVTVQTHANVVAVAVMKELAGVIIAGGRPPEAETLERAVRERVPLLSSALPAYQIVSQLCASGIEGRPRDAPGV